MAVLLLTLGLSAQRPCSSTPYHEALKASDPRIAQGLLEAESFQTRIAALRTRNTAREQDAVIRIPVVVHIVYNTPDQNIPDAQVQSQLDVLNRDFRRRNADSANTPERFRGLAADVGLEFVLATADPNGYATTGIVRKHSSVSNWTNDDKIKFAASGGSAAWDSRSYLNIWVGPMRTLLGYASAPGGVADRDGVVIATKAMGTINVSAPYHLGRTGTHEVGHWLGLRHIWGDTYCGDDGIADTPKQGNFTAGCPTSVRSSCGNTATGDMFMNYMDFTNDACTNLFTEGQKDRMRSAFATGGPRAALQQSRGLDKPWNKTPAAPQEVPATTAAPTAKLYPNPAASVVNIDLGCTTYAGCVLTVHSANGALVLRNTISGRQHKLTVSSLAPGMYWLSTQKDGQTVRLSFVKQ
ncbi:M43 family zinc metalloprotease [Flaviaesturariibacter amylovorans]|uniref:T9SS type A sorting domain-containing protein n=1 Tax=Flaviaesturariibacter amylovorans TaxID=1084520 RepID=A0ABP8GY85_9BACT